MLHDRRAPSRQGADAALDPGGSSSSIIAGGGPVLGVVAQPPRSKKSSDGERWGRSRDGIEREANSCAHSLASKGAGIVAGKCADVTRFDSGHITHIRRERRGFTAPLRHVILHH